MTIKHDMRTGAHASISSTRVSLAARPINTPAITIVELCNNAEIGVGADMAFKSQELNGSCADFVKQMAIKARWNAVAPFEQDRRELKKRLKTKEKDAGAQ
jgi:hypothetical protein